MLHEQTGHAVDLGLVLLALWLFTQLNPETLLFGNGDLRDLLAAQPADFYAAATFARIEAGVAAGLPVSVCGEMASEPLDALLLIGLGYRCLSVAPPALPLVKWLLRAVPLADAAAGAPKDLTPPALRPWQRLGVKLAAAFALLTLVTVGLVGALVASYAGSMFQTCVIHIAG